ncbi:MAG: ankyrin repeat domain-containing protein [Bacteroidales bacterium]|nr:ankyrin repeat domain-containing protein [Bacteroidales bacterium]
MIKKLLFTQFLLLILLQFLNAQEIQVTIKGFDDGIKTSKLQDYKEAVTNAKIEAIERAGSEITSYTKIVNFQMKYESVESKAEAVLLPGYDIMDIGYQTDGTYLVILSGSVSSGEKESPEELYNKSVLYLKLNKNLGIALNNFENIINKYPESIEAINSLEKIVEVKNQIIKNWEICYNKSYYPNKSYSEYIIWLFENGNDPEIYESINGSIWYFVISLAFRANHPEEEIIKAVQIVLENHKNHMNYYASDKRTALHLASQKCNTKVMKILLDAGYDISTKTRWEATPLHLVCYSSRDGSGIEAAKYLIENGANLHSKNYEGREPIDMVSYSDLKFRKFIESYY